MKKTLTFLSALALAACNSGGGSAPVAVVPNTPGGGDQEAYYANFKEYFDNVIKTGADGGSYSDFAETEPSWPAHGGYKHYVYKEHTYTPENGQTIIQHVVDEKEMQLANYGVHVTMPNDANHLPDTVDAYVHNREGVGANLYEPASGAVFTGGTLAYLNFPGQNGYAAPATSVLIKGDATYTYNSLHPELLLEFDNYYTFNITQQDGSYETIDVSGTNNTGTAVFNVTTGHYVNVGDDTNVTTAHFQKDAIQEVAGTYEITFGQGDNLVGDTAFGFTMHGAFGGSH